MVSFLALLAIRIGVLILMRLITPKAKRPKAQPFEVPTSEDGAPIPKVFGMQEVSGNLMLVKDARVSEENDGTRTRYWARIALALGWGPFDVLFDILSDEKSLSLQRPGRKQSVGGSEPITTVPFPIALSGDAPVKFNIAALDMFGGGDEEGGLNGEVAFYRGTDAQPLDPLIVYGYGEFASRYPHLGYIRFGTAPDEETTSAQGSDFHWTANNPTPKPVSVVVGAYPHGLVDQAAALGITSYTNPRIGHDANPMEVIWECLTNRIWGASESLEQFDIPNLIAAAERFLAEGKGISTTFVSQSLDDFIDDVERHVRAMLVENPKTGLIQMQFLRPDYVVAELPILTKENTFNFRQHEGHFLDTLNQIEVRYRKFVGGERGVFTDVLATASAVFVPYNTLFPAGISGPPVHVGHFIWQSPGRRIINVSATRTRAAVTVALTYGVDFKYVADDGWFQFYSNPSTGTLLPGDEIRVSYESIPIYTGFIDATASAQNLANFQITGSVRRESYDMGMFTQEILAQEAADFYKLMSGRKLAVLSWNAHRNTSGLRAGDVVLANEIDYRLSNVPIRITRIGYGTIEAPALRFEGLEDVFGEQLGAFPFVPGHAVVTPGPVVEISERVVLSCLGGATRVGLFSTDPQLTIELWTADDATGTGAVLIATLPGTTRFYDDAQTVGVERFYAAKLTGAGYESTELTEWMGCTASADPPSDPTDTLPTWTVLQSQTETEGTATLTITDPQSRVLSIQRNEQAGTGLPTEFVPFSAEPYTETVSIVAPNLSYITFRITYLDLDGTEVTDDVPVTFDPNPPAPPTPTIPDAAGGQVILPFHTTLSRGVVFGSAETGFPPPELTELAEFGRRRIDATGLKYCIGQVQVSHPLPSGGLVKWQYVPASIANPVEEDWTDLDSVTGPVILVDTPSEIPTLSRKAQINLNARQDIVIRPVCVGGNSLVPLGIKEMLLTFLGDAVGADGDEGEQVPDPCDDSTINFGGYESTVDMEADGWTNIPDASAGGGMHLDPTGGPDGGAALSMDIHSSMTFNYSTVHRVEYPLPLLDDTKTYKIEFELKIDSTFQDEPQYDAGHYSFSVGVQLGSAQRILWFGGVPAGGLLDAHEFVGEYKHVDVNSSGSPLTFIPPPGGQAYFRMDFTSLIGGANATHHIWVANIKLTELATGEIVSPCHAGPTLPEDPGTGGPLPPALPPPETGQRAVGVWGYPSPFTAYPPFYGVAKRFDIPTVVSELNQLRALGYRAMLDPVARPGSLVNGVFSLAKYMETLNRWTALASVIADFQDVISGIMVIDEPFCAACWGLSAPMQFSVIDGVMAKRISEIFPDYIPFIRVSGRRILRTGQIPRYIRGCWNQMEGVQDGTRTVQEYMAMHQTAARQLNLRWVWGLNIHNYTPSHRILTPADIRYAAIPMAQDQESHGVYLWAGIGVRGMQDKYALLQTAPYISAWNDVIAAMTP